MITKHMAVKWQQIVSGMTIVKLKRPVSFIQLVSRLTPAYISIIYIMVLLKPRMWFFTNIDHSSILSRPLLIKNIHLSITNTQYKNTHFIIKLLVHFSLNCLLWYNRQVLLDNSLHFFDIFGKFHFSCRFPNNISVMP